MKVFKNVNKRWIDNSCVYEIVLISHSLGEKGGRDENDLKLGVIWESN